MSKYDIPGKEGSIAQAARAAVWAYAQVLKLYPRGFHTSFGTEMVDVFSLAAVDAARRGNGPLARLLLRELGDLPVNIILAHIHERRKRLMDWIGYDPRQDLASIRWIARALALLLAGLIFSLWLFNEDVRRAPTLPMLVLTALSVFMLAAWRWEKVGGSLTLLGSPLCLIAAMVMAGQVDQANLALAALVGLALTLVTGLVGWLFVSVARHSTVAAGPHVGREAPRRRRYLVYAAIVLVVLLLLALSLVAAPYQEIRMEGGGRPGTPMMVTVEAPAAR